MTSNGRGKHFDELEVGMSFNSQGRTVTESDLVTFAGLSGDYNQLHTDEEFARRTPFRRRIAHGMLINSIATGLGFQTGIFEGTTVALMEILIKNRDPVYIGDTVSLTLTVAEKREVPSPRRGIVVFDTVVRKQDGRSAIEGQWVVMMRRTRKCKPAAEPAEAR